jgi:hypothetical protein
MQKPIEGVYRNGAFHNQKPSQKQPPLNLTATTLKTSATQPAPRFHHVDSTFI